VEVERVEGMKVWVSQRNGPEDGPG
jgi:hypothetical protein